MQHEGEIPETEVDKVFRWSTWLVGVVILVGVAGTVAWQFLSVAKDANRTIGDLLATLRTAGLEVSEGKPLPNTAGAKWADTADINGKPVNFYRFAVEVDKDQITKLDAIKQSGNIEVDGKPVSARVNGPFVMTGYEGNPREQDLLSAFDGFGTF